MVPIIGGYIKMCSDTDKGHTVPVVLGLSDPSGRIEGQFYFRLKPD